MERKLFRQRFPILALITLLLGCGVTIYWLWYRLGFLMSVQQFASIVCLSCQSDNRVHTPLKNDRLTSFFQLVASS